MALAAETGNLLAVAEGGACSFGLRGAGALPGFTLAHGGFAPALGAVMLARERSTRTAAPPEFPGNLRRSARHFAASIR
ncbi:MAG: hypothetical protein KKH28_05210 [Elusimicrobia bacterium]|nr:hypothetical protein [Elusimicrobiota bacterium]